jgi:hypothetical protein
MERGSQMLVDSIDYTEDKRSKAQEVILEKQFDSFKERAFKERDKAINETHVNMVKKIIGLIQVMKVLASYGLHKKMSQFDNFQYLSKFHASWWKFEK